MNAEEFIHVIKLVVRDAAITDTIDVLARPPGRKPSQELLNQAEWYKSLSQQERSLLADVLARAVDCAVFGFSVSSTACASLRTAQSRANSSLVT